VYDDVTCVYDDVTCVYASIHASNLKFPSMHASSVEVGTYMRTHSLVRDEREREREREREIY
jgi:hypothetical protein